MSDWVIKKLGEIVTLQRGHDLPLQARVDGSVPIMGSAGPTGWHNEVKQKGPGVVVGRSGNSMGEVSFTLEDYWPLNTCLYVTDFKGNHERFIFYLLKTINFDQFNSGSAQKSLNRNAVYPFEIYLSENTKEQANIAGILESLENKIENNHQINQTFEQIAQAIFKSWFVDFEPVKAKQHVCALGGNDAQTERAAQAVIAGAVNLDIITAATDLSALDQQLNEALSKKLAHQTEAQRDQLAITASHFPYQLVESELGLIPEGWGVVALKDCCLRVESGGTPKRSKSSFWNGNIPWLSSGEVRNLIILDTKEKITEAGLKNSSAKRWPSGSIVVAMYGATAGQICLLVNEMSANQACCALIPKKYYQNFIFLSARRSLESLSGKASGSAQQNLNKSLVAEHRVLISREKVLEAFETFTSSLLGGWIKNMEQDVVLSELRDSLLPKLLSGELDLSGAYRNTAKVV